MTNKSHHRQPRQVNISRDAFRAALATADARGTHDEREFLQTTSMSLPHCIRFRHVRHGRQISLRTWLTAFRASQRGRASLPGLSAVGQRRLMASVVANCPKFFAGLTELEMTRDEYLASHPRLAASEPALAPAE